MKSFQLRIQILLVFFYWLVPNQFIYSQNDHMLAYYGKKYSNIKLDSTKISERILKLHNELEKQISLSMSEVEYQLIFTKTESLFKVTERLEQGSNDMLDLAIMRADGDGLRYNNLQTNEKLHQKEFFGKLLLIDISAREQKWDFVNETKKIGQFNCFKATSIKTTRNPVGTFKKPVVVWYTTELPFSHGPIGYGGLPGLIVELSYENATYFLKSVDFNPKTTYKIEKPAKGKKVSIEEYYDMQQGAMQNASFN
jgi:GLPGLI family protein